MTLHSDLFFWALLSFCFFLRWSIDGPFFLLFSHGFYSSSILRLELRLFNPILHGDGGEEKSHFSTLRFFCDKSPQQKDFFLFEINLTLSHISSRITSKNLELLR